MGRFDEMSEPIDYEELLKKYMDHVGQCEGTTFIEGYRNGSGYGESDIVFTDEEWEELERLDRDA